MSDAETIPAPRRILFVCMGNICRSPTAEGMFDHVARQEGLRERYEIDSAGTGGWHQGEPPDPRAIEAAARRGIDLSAQRARQVEPSDFHAFDLILAMDGSNFTNLSRAAPAQRRAEIALITDFAGPGAPTEVGDPYYGGADGFEAVLDLLEECCRGLLDAQAR